MKKTTTTKMRKISALLIYDSKGNPLENALRVEKLDFSVSSLKEVQKYLENIRASKPKMTGEKISKVILIVGAYLGEVLRKKEGKRFAWMSYSEASKLGKGIHNYEKNILTGFVIYDKKSDGFWFPLNKVYKFIEHGRTEDLLSFAEFCLGKSKRLKKR